MLQTDSDVKDDLDKDQINAPVAMMTTATNNTDDNGGGRGGSGTGGWVNTIVEEESNENAILPSHETENLKFLCEAWLARLQSAHVSSTLLPAAKEYEEIIQTWLDKKRFESLFNRKRKKFRGAGDGPTAADEGSNAATQPCRLYPWPLLLSSNKDSWKYCCKGAINEAILGGSQFKVATAADLSSPPKRHCARYL